MVRRGPKIGPYSEIYETILNILTEEPDLNVNGIIRRLREKGVASSPNLIVRHLKTLEKKGMIEPTQKLGRGIAIKAYHITEAYKSVIERRAMREESFIKTPLIRKWDELGELEEIRERLSKFINEFLEKEEKITEEDLLKETGEKEFMWRGRILKPPFYARSLKDILIDLNDAFDEQAKTSLKKYLESITDTVKRKTEFLLLDVIFSYFLTKKEILTSDIRFFYMDSIETIKDYIESIEEDVQSWLEDIIYGMDKEFFDKIEEIKKSDIEEEILGRSQ